MKGRVYGVQGAGFRGVRKLLRLESRVCLVWEGPALGPESRGIHILPPCLNGLY